MIEADDINTEAGEEDECADHPYVPIDRACLQCLQVFCSHCPKPEALTGCAEGNRPEICISVNFMDSYAIISRSR